MKCSIWSESEALELQFAPSVRYPTMSEAPADGSKAADQSGGVVPEFEDLKVVVRTIKLANPDMGVAKVRSRDPCQHRISSHI